MTSLRRVQIRGFKSIRELDVELGPLTVLIGANGAGKSNLVSFFKMLSFAMTGALQEWVGRNGGADALLHYGAGTTPRMEGSFEFETPAGTNAYAFSLAHAAGDTLIFTDESVQFARRNHPGNPIGGSLGAGHRESLLTQAAHKGDKTAHVAQAVMCRWKFYQFHDTSPEASARQHHYIEDNSYLRADAGNLAPFLHRLGTTHPQHYDRIVSTIRLVAPFFGDFELQPSALNGERIMLNWRERDRDVLFGPHQLSDGTLRFMALATLFLQPSELLPNLIVVDEPELGLHPYAINALADIVRAVSLSCQVLLSTQSATLVDCFAPEEIVVVDREAGASQFRHVDVDALSEWLDDYDCDYSLSELWMKNLLGGRPSR